VSSPFDLVSETWFSFVLTVKENISLAGYKGKLFLVNQGPNENIKTHKLMLWLRLV